jgi:apolipoprotein N-acyltransferase
VNGRYDKQDLLALVEKPLFGGKVILPFLAASGLQMQTGNYGGAVKTPWGRAGVMLCNESTNASLAKKLVDNGASFLVNMGNDNWFSGSYIPRQHFYNCRLRAVENRKDIIVNNNMGMAGVIKASGEITSGSDGKDSRVEFAAVTPNNLPAGNTVVFICIVFCVLLFTMINYFSFKFSNQSISKPSNSK